MAHWIAENTRTKSIMWVCSECGKVAHDSPCGSKKYQVSKKPCSLQYCPHCGVKMDEEQETESMITCFKCHGEGKYEVFTWDDEIPCVTTSREKVKCEICGGTGKITIEAYEWFQWRWEKTEHTYGTK